MSARLSIAAPGVAVVELARPPVNAMDAGGYHAVAEVFDGLAADAGVRAVVLTGEGDRAFSAGTDTAAFAGAAAYAQVSAAGRRFFEALAGLPVPIVGALNGPAVGGGAMIAAECDVLLAAPQTWLSIPELSLGVPGAASHVKRLAPYFKVQRMLLLGERLTAEEALAGGAILRIVEREGLVAAAVAVAARIARLDPGAVRAAREILRAPERDAALAGYRAELTAAGALIGARAP